MFGQRVFSSGGANCGGNDFGKRRDDASDLGTGMAQHVGGRKRQRNGHLMAANSMAAAVAATRNRSVMVRN